MRYALTLAIVTLSCVQLSAQCGPNGCRVGPQQAFPVLFQPPPAPPAAPAGYEWHPLPNAPDQLALMRGGVHVGGYDFTRCEYRPIVGGEWGDPCDPPFRLPAREVGAGDNFGVDKSKVGRAGRRYTFTGVECTRRQAMEAIAAGLEDDTSKMSLIVVGPEDRRKAYLVQPSLVAVMGQVKVHGRDGLGYNADDWQIAERGIKPSADGDVILTNPDGGVLYRGKLSDSPATLIDCINKRRPASDPAKTNLWLIVAAAFAAAGGYLLWTNRKGTK